MGDRQRHLGRADRVRSRVGGIERGHAARRATPRLATTVWSRSPSASPRQAAASSFRFVDPTTYWMVTADPTTLRWTVTQVIEGSDSTRRSSWPPCSTASRSRSRSPARRFGSSSTGSSTSACSTRCPPGPLGRPRGHRRGCGRCPLGQVSRPRSTRPARVRRVSAVPGAGVSARSGTILPRRPAGTRARRPRGEHDG